MKEKQSKVVSNINDNSNFIEKKEVDTQIEDIDLPTDNFQEYSEDVPGYFM